MILYYALYIKVYRFLTSICVTINRVKSTLTVSFHVKYSHRQRKNSIHKVPCWSHLRMWFQIHVTLHNHNNQSFMTFLVEYNEVLDITCLWWNKDVLFSFYQENICLASTTVISLFDIALLFPISPLKNL